jgi:D-alanyl-D-alanine carboxypeptidase
MQGAARSEDVWLIPISGFRTVGIQQTTFFDLKAECRQSATERAKVSAPPGYSEHHTGYALDIGDATDPTTFLRQEFEEGAAYRWLQQNAARFHFELSFPKDNFQGIMYEPWHWRFVGDDHSLHTFYAPHKLRKSFPGCKS